MIADLEASPKATAIATEKAIYRRTSAKHASRPGARLTSINAKIDSSQLQQIDIFESIKLQPKNDSQLTEAAN
ncbi:MAG TPA: hypothetical protein DEF45_02655 [Rhodopirellula sp.]|nr:hypothetical protein [Rhodopirellula sp.]